MVSLSTSLVVGTITGGYSTIIRASTLLYTLTPTIYQKCKCPFRFAEVLSSEGDATLHDKLLSTFSSMQWHRSFYLFSRRPITERETSSHWRWRKRRHQGTSWQSIFLPPSKCTLPPMLRQLRNDQGTCYHWPSSPSSLDDDVLKSRKTAVDIC